MSQPSRDEPTRTRRSASADAAALKWSDDHPDEDLAPAPESPGEIAEDADAPRRSASAESAALRDQEKRER